MGDRKINFWSSWRTGVRALYVELLIRLSPVGESLADPLEQSNLQKSKERKKNEVA